MEIAQEIVGEVLVVGPKGRLDTETSGELELALHDAFEAGRFHFLIDMAGVSYVSSAGLRVLLAQAKKLDGGIGGMRICGMNQTVRSVFDLSGFSALFKISPTRADALKIMPAAQAKTGPMQSVAPAAPAAKPAPVVTPSAAPPPPAQAAAPAPIAAPAPQPASSPKSAAELLGAGSAGTAPTKAAQTDLAASLLGIGSKPKAPVADSERATAIQDKVSAPLAKPAAPPPEAKSPPASTTPAKPAASPSAPVTSAPPATPGADKAAPKKGGWSKLFK